MKLSIDFEYILKRLFVIVLAFIIISQLKSCNVNAANLTPNYYIAYWNQENSYQSPTTGDTRSFSSIPLKGRYLVSANIGVNDFSYKGTIRMECELPYQSFNSGVYLRDTNNSNALVPIDNSCVSSVQDVPCYHNDAIIVGRYCTNITYTCSKMTNSINANGIVLDVGFSSGSPTPYNCITSISTNYLSTQLSAMQQQIANDDKNTNSINNSINDVNSNITDVYDELSNVSDKLGQINKNQFSCRDQNIKNTINSGYLDSNGNIVSSSNYGITGFIRVYSETSSRIIQPTPDTVYYCLYSSNNNLIACSREDRQHTINYTGYDTSVYFVRFSVLKDSSSTRPLVETCEINRGQGVIEYLDGTLSNADDTSGINGFFGRQIGSNFGLEAVINGPINMIQRATETCSPKSFSLFGQTITIPCGTDLFWERDFTKDFQGRSRAKTPIGNTNTSSLNSIRDTFRTFWCTLFGGAILFHLALKLWKETQKALDPLADSYETISSAIDTSSSSRPQKDLSEITDVNEYLNLKEL